MNNTKQYSSSALKFALVVFLTAIASTSQTQGMLPATDTNAAEILQFLDALPQDEISDDPIRIADAGSHLVGVYGAFRPVENPGPVVLHEVSGSEIYYILEGSGVLVTGGEMSNSRPLREGGTTLIGSAAGGGVSRRVGPGDIIVIPGGTTHQWASLDSDIRYLILRADPEKRLRMR